MTNNEFGLLKKVVVGREHEFSKRQIDFTFKQMYKANLGLNLIYNQGFTQYKIDYEISNERIQDLDNLSSLLESFGIEVIRPDGFKTPEFFKYIDNNDYMKSCANSTRDLIFTYKDLLLETNTFVIPRLFENKLFIDKIKNNKIFESIQTDIYPEKIDTEDWEIAKSRIDKVLTEGNLESFESYIEAANLLKINDDILVNIGSVDQYKGYLQIKEIIKRYYPKTELHPIYMADNHIDGTLMPLTEGVFLANEMFLKTNYIKDNLPEKFKNWKIIYARDQYMENKKYWEEINKCPIALASTRGMDINILSLDRKRIIIQDSAYKTIDVLADNGFEPIPIQFRHSELFAGGIHCSTLDLERDN